MIANLDEKFTPDFVVDLGQNEVFVFGSNLNGVHTGGASMMALKNFGANWGQAEGPQGQSYAIPTDIRGEAVDNVSAYLKRHIDKFIDYAKAHQGKTFLVTKVGCGNAGFDVEFMAQFFKETLEMKNVRLPREFVEIYNTSKREKTEFYLRFDVEYEKSRKETDKPFFCFNVTIQNHGGYLFSKGVVDGGGI